MTTEDTSAEWITLGTCGGPFQRPEAFQISNALVVGDDVYLFDLGNGTLRRLAELGIDVARVRGVFMTHHHPDHIADLGLVMLTHWLTPGNRRVTIGGPVGTAHLVAGLAEAYRYTELIEGPDKPGIRNRFDVAETDADLADRPVELYRDEVVTVEAVRVEHFRSTEPLSGEQPQAIGLRVSTPERTFAYTGDTGAAPSLEALARDVDLFVSEVVAVPDIIDDLRARFAHAPEVVDRVEFNMRHNHIAPPDIGRIARSAGAKSVLLTHFVPVLDDAARARLAQEVKAEAGSIDVHVARDLGRY